MPRAQARQPAFHPKDFTPKTSHPRQPHQTAPFIQAPQGPHKQTPASSSPAPHSHPHKHSNPHPQNKQQEKAHLCVHSKTQQNAPKTHEKHILPSPLPSTKTKPRAALSSPTSSSSTTPSGNAYRLHNAPCVDISFFTNGILNAPHILFLKAAFSSSNKTLAPKKATKSSTTPITLPLSLPLALHLHPHIPAHPPRATYGETHPAKTSSTFRNNS